MLKVLVEGVLVVGAVIGSLYIITAAEKQALKNKKMLAEINKNLDKIKDNLDF